ncbi:MAG: hypothetical protein HY720_19395 [Planctomycetes bacterium]|nr:hypothetical protein [Planctomycetota bacterium]
MDSRTTLSCLQEAVGSHPWIAAELALLLLGPALFATFLLAVPPGPGKAARARDARLLASFVLPLGLAGLAPRLALAWPLVALWGGAALALLLLFFRRMTNAGMLALAAASGAIGGSGFLALAGEFGLPAEAFAAYLLLGSGILLVELAGLAAEAREPAGACRWLLAAQGAVAGLLAAPTVLSAATGAAVGGLLSAALLDADRPEDSLALRARRRFQGATGILGWAGLATIAGFLFHGASPGAASLTLAVLVVAVGELAAGAVRSSVENDDPHRPGTSGRLARSFPLAALLMEGARLDPGPLDHLAASIHARLRDPVAARVARVCLRLPAIRTILGVAFFALWLGRELAVWGRAARTHRRVTRGGTMNAPLSRFARAIENLDGRARARLAEVLLARAPALLKNLRPSLWKDPAALAAGFDGTCDAMVLARALSPAPSPQAWASLLERLDPSTIASLARAALATGRSTR